MQNGISKLTDFACFGVFSAVLGVTNDDFYPRTILCRRMCKVIGGSVSSGGLEREGRREGEWQTDTSSWCVLYQCLKAGSNYWMLLTCLRNPSERGEESRVGLFRGSAPVLFLRGDRRGG